MNRNRMIVLGTIALALSVGVTFLAYRFLADAPKATTRIVVAAKKLSQGTQLTTQDLTTAAWPKSLPLEGSINDIKQAEGRGVIVEMLPNEPVLESKLAPKDGGIGLTAIIPQGSRAVAVKVNDVIGVAGFVLPGTYVDVILVGQPRQNEDPASKVIVENVKVLTAGQVLKNEKGEPLNVQVVTLQVTPEQAEKVSLAVSDGRMQLALRNPLDKVSTDPPVVRRPDLFYGAALAAPPPNIPVRISSGSSSGSGVKTVPRSRPPQKAGIFEVELIQGNKITKETFIMQGSKTTKQALEMKQP